MAELATIARPYAEALHRASGDDGAALRGQLASLAAVAANPQLRQFADNPKAVADEVYGVVSGVAGGTLDPRVQNLLRAVIDNGRLAALPEIATQYAALVNAGSGVADATVYSAFPIDHTQLLDVSEALEKRYGRKLKVTVRTDPSLIGGIRAVVGDAVLDLSVKARLEQMKAALTA